MKSTTSLFNPTLYRKTMSRFWPMWAGYALLLLFMLPLDLVNNMFHRSMNPASDKLSFLLDLTSNLPWQLSFHSVLLMMGAVLCAMAVFGYLFNHRSACMMHALPMRRETLFLTQYLAGLSFMLLPILAVGLVMLATELVLVPSAYWSAVLPSLGTLLLTMVQLAFFYFSLAAFCAMLTGHMLALPVFYMVCNMLAMGVYGLCADLAQQFFFGMTRNSAGEDLAFHLSPVFCLSGAVSWQRGTSRFDEADLPILHPGHLNAPSTVAIYTLVGLVLALAALAIYRRRHIETAGDVVSVRLVRPLFKIGVSFCTGLFLGVFTSITIFWNDLSALCVLVVLWSVVGWFAAEMLLQKSFRVFRRWRGCAAMAGAMALLCAVCYFDWFGVETRVPATGSVESATVHIDLGSPYDAGQSVVLSLQNNPQLMEDFAALHRSIVEQRPQNRSDSYRMGAGDSYTSFVISYTLKNGRSLNRAYYNIPLLRNEAQDKTSITGQLVALSQNRTLVERAYNFDRFADMKLVDVQLNGLIDTHTSDIISDVSLTDLNGQQRLALWEAVQQDFAEGNLGRRFLLNNSRERYENSMYTDLVFCWFAENPSHPTSPVTTRPVPDDAVDDSSYNDPITITLSPQAVHTLSLLEEYHALGEDYQLIPYQFDNPDSPGYVDPTRMSG